MAEVTHPQPTAPEERSGTSATQTHDKGVSLEDLGEGSIHIFILAAGALLITPVGNIYAIVVLLGLVVAAFGVQLVLRRPFVSLPSAVRTVFERSRPGQAFLRFLNGNTSTWLSYQRKAPHWLMVRPFDILARGLVPICGLVIMVTAGVPTMAHVLGVVALLISVSLLARHMAIFFFGAVLLSWSSILPLVNS